MAAAPPQPAVAGPPPLPAVVRAPLRPNAESPLRNINVLKNKDPITAPEYGIEKEIIDDTPWDVPLTDDPLKPDTPNKWFKLPPGYTVETQAVAARMGETLSTFTSFVSIIDGRALGGVGGAASAILNATQISGTSALLGTAGAPYVVPGVTTGKPQIGTKDYIDYAKIARERVQGFGMAAAAGVAYRRVFNQDVTVRERQALSAWPIAALHVATVIQAISVAG